MAETQQIQTIELVELTDLETNPAHVYLMSLAQSSRETMARALDVIAELASAGNADRLSLAWPQLRFQHTAAIRAELMARYKPATANRMLSALRSVLKTAWRLGLMSAEDYHRSADIENISGQSLPPGRAISSGELGALLAACDSGPLGARDAAIIGLMYSGLRRAEVAGADLADVNRAGKEIKVKGKGRKERSVPLMAGADLALDDWLASRGLDDGPLFVNIRKGGHLTDRRLTPRGVNHILSQRAELAGVERLTPHDFRRTVIGDLLDAGADIKTVADLVGHADVNTTGRYDRRGDKAKRKAVGLLHLPYRR